jgi:Lipopolysaccharide kinase (Kdo/WaaP) family
MGLSPEYHKYRDGPWQLWVLQEKWSAELWQSVLAVITEQSPSKHPQTAQLSWPPDQLAATLYLKIFHGDFGWRALKDIFRQSKAVRSMHQTVALSRFNFNVPLTVAAGEKREQRFLRKAFVLTLGVKAQSIPILLNEHRRADNNLTLLEKRHALRQLAMEVRRLHELGFVHGDLLPTNILVARAEGKENRFFFMDNDRTRRYPRWMTPALRRRNLVQLNRLPLPGITLQDRVRFLSHYLELKQWGKGERRLLTWLEHKTRQRRRECDAVDASGSFRQLMRWDGQLT